MHSLNQWSLLKEHLDDMLERGEKKKQLHCVILSASEESRVMGYEILRWRSE
jgi:hypothetical protein